MKAVFQDREHAGNVLATTMLELERSGAWILAVPAGGVPVGAAICRTLSLPFDVAVVSKVTLPWNRETGYGAVAFDGTVHLNRNLTPRQLGLEHLEVRYGIEKTKAKVELRVRDLHGDGGFGHLEGATVVLVDDGLASGVTMLTAIEAARKLKVASVRVAVPTASRDAASLVAREVDRLYCVDTRSGFPFAVADAYEHWSDVEEDELHRIIVSLRHEGRMSIGVGNGAS